MRVVDDPLWRTSPPLNKWRKLVMWKRNQCRLCLAAIWLMIVPQVARAQEVEAASSRFNEEETRQDAASTEFDSVVVSATRIPIPQENSPATISIIPAEDLEQKQIERVADAI